MDNTTRSPRACAQVITRGPRRKPGASLYILKRFSLSLSWVDLIFVVCAGTCIPVMRHIRRFWEAALCHILYITP
jgi:hypothetical protein